MASNFKEAELLIRGLKSDGVLTLSSTADYLLAHSALMTLIHAGMLFHDESETDDLVFRLTRQGSTAAAALSAG